MPQLVKKIQGNLIEVIIGDVINHKLIEGEIGIGDYIDLTAFKGYIQNLDKAQESETLIKPLLFGLKSTTNEVVLEISY